MGAWATDSFANDDALDWLIDFADAPTIEMLRDTLEHVTARDADEYLEAPDCCEAIAAAEIVAALSGKPSAKLPTDLTAWLATDHELNASPLRAAALSAIERIARESELQELWTESDGRLAWETDMKDLLQRLA